MISGRFCLCYAGLELRKEPDLEDDVACHVWPIGGYSANGRKLMQLPVFAEDDMKT